MTALQLSVCRSCGARIVWVRTARGKKMPLDAEPGPQGDFVIVPSVDGGDIAVQVTPKTAEFYHDIAARYRSHFATCPQGKEWRRRD